MPRARVLTPAIALVALLLGTACGTPPEKEMQQAQGAIDAARAAGADEYAHDEFVAAQEAFQHALEAVKDRDYRLALNHALDSRERAQTAAKQAADEKAAARTGAERAIATADDALTQARARLKAAETSRVSARVLLEPRRAINTSDQAVQKARAAFSNGDYPAVSRLLETVTERLRVAVHDLEVAAATPARRRR